jgi:hypothetical protein
MRREISNADARGETLLISKKAIAFHRCINKSHSYIKQNEFFVFLFNIIKLHMGFNM